MLMSRALFTICAIVVTAVPTWADTIRITSGALDGSDSNITGFAVEGGGLRLIGIVDSDAFGEPHWRCDPLPCSIGSPLSLSRSYTGFEDVAGTFDGVLYSDVRTTLDFTSSTITIPDMAVGENRILTRPFTFTGSAMGFRDGVMGFSHQLVGSGTVTIRMNRSDPEFGGDGVNAYWTTYAFESDASTVPEPASMLLLGSGIAGLAAMGRRRANAKRTQQS